MSYLDDKGFGPSSLVPRNGVVRAVTLPMVSHCFCALRSSCKPTNLAEGDDSAMDCR